ncbi:MAG TPA: cytochrome c-type biogenesis protein CcmH [Gemmatimonadales bacterium]|nr:cytochrome c-type biogenesis protein CcmH [Gemmatimonadales bacterium]
MIARRDFLRGISLAALPLLQQQAPTTPGDQAETGTLRDPLSAGRARERVNPEDNDAEVMAIEKRLQCTCGCTLDIYTCRTTDFTCTYSPELHREVLALRADGKDAEQIVAAFVAKYGEKVLMAPKPVGFNWTGYLLPGTLLLLVGGGLFVILRRRTAAQQAVASATPAPMVTDASPEELAELERALKESEQ